MDKVAALDVGADDYVTKPFSMPEMLGADSRRASQKFDAARDGDSQRVDRRCGSRFSFAPADLQWQADPVESAKEFDLLFAYLAAHPNRAIPHEELLHAVWGPEYGEEREYLRVFINRLRKKIEPSPQDPQFLIKEAVGSGYSLKLSDK